MKKYFVSKILVLFWKLVTRKYKYALAGLSLAASAATSIYFGVQGFFPPEPPFENTAYQQKNTGKEFIRGGVNDPEWLVKSNAFHSEFSDKNRIKSTAFSGVDLQKYSRFIDGYKKGDEKSKVEIKNFLYEWCRDNRASKNESIFHLIGSYCVKGNTSRSR